ncbi:hypothetical protein ACHAWC_004801 [Mediolabrus comicus]
MATKPAIQAAALLSLRGLRRRRLGHIGPNHYQNDLDKWGRKKINGTPSTLLGVNGGRRPAPRASLVLGGQPPRRRNNGNGLDKQIAAAKSSATKINGNDIKENGFISNGFEQNMLRASRSYANGATDTKNGLNGNSSARVDQNTSENSSDETKKGYSSDLVVVLDMDECLIHSQFLSDQLVDKYRQVEDRPATSSSSSFHQGEEAESIILSTCQSFRISLPDGDLVNVNKRPNLDIFLKEITSRYETYIFTAAMEVYASPVLDVLDPNNEMFRGRFYRDTCVYSPDLGVYAKDLCEVLRQRKVIINSEEMKEECYDDENNCLECDERRVVLVDNNPLSFLPNPSNGILVSSFYDDPKDDTLEAVMELLYELDESDDVRPILDEKFGLKDALNELSW